MTAMSLNGPGSIVLARRFVNTFVHVLIGIVCYTFTRDPIAHLQWDNKLSWHIILCAFGYLVFMGEGLLVFSPDNAFTNMLQRNSCKKLHITLFSFGFFISFIGGLLIWLWKDEIGLSHLVSVHAIMGFISLILGLITCCNGLVVLYARRVFPNVRHVIFKSFHYAVGILAFVTGMICIAQKINDLHSGGFAELTVMVYLICVLSIIYAVVSCAKAIKKVFVS